SRTPSFDQEDLRHFKVKGHSKYYKKIKKLKRKTVYYARVRTYKTINGTDYCGSWSPAKRVKTK
ncbi:MAG: hypothetical protein Q4A65_03235, partial [Bacillota bacterium]|nr:hypothetical protein [Bacillota bacterium]